MAAWLRGHGRSIGCFPPTCVFLGSSPVHLLVRVSAMGCQPGFQTESHNGITLLWSPDLWKFLCFVKIESSLQGPAQPEM